MAAFYTFEDLSGSATPNHSPRPYEALIEACNNDPVSMPEAGLRIYDH